MMNECALIENYFPDAFKSTPIGLYCSWQLWERHSTNYPDQLFHELQQADAGECRPARYRLVACSTQTAYGRPLTMNVRSSPPNLSFTKLLICRHVQQHTSNACWPWSIRVLRDVFTEHCSCPLA
eukprot:GHRQ01029322.1.p1 GENE.GHRQ01029322.1~~GHRQ01029322.1.p1  ORF type:complete len:125 (-),score=0.84 GHRQ01029322.1:470-844(-)